MDTAVIFSLSGCANNQPITITGSGEIRESDEVGDETRHLHITLRKEPASAPWDPTFALLGGLDGLLLAAAGVFGRNGAEPDEPIIAHTRAHVFDEGNREVGRIATRSQTTIEQGVITCHAQMLHAEVLLEVAERVAGVTYGGVAVLSHSQGTSVLTEVAMDTTRGAELQASVVTRVAALDPHSESNDIARISVSFEMIKRRRTTDGSAEVVECKVRVGVASPRNRPQ